MSKIVDDIERTNEYNKFIDDLKTFHTAKGTTLQVEPILGGKKLDLYKIYKVVMDAGGFDQVTRGRRWKYIGDGFNFPSTCTNSAYILKGVYIRNLLGWEEEKMWGKTWNPPDELRGPNAHKASTLAGKSFKNKNGTTLRQKRMQHMTTPSYTPIRPDPTPRGTMSMAGLGLSLPKIPTSFSFEEIAIRNEPTQCTISEVHHQNHPSEHMHVFEEERMACLKANNIEVNDKERILRSLQSTNKMDVDWALNCIVTISFECPEQLLLDGTPRLLDLLIERGSPFFGDYDRSATIKVLHILRNFSFLQVNAQTLAGSRDLQTMLQKCLALAATDDAELKRHCIDVLENITPYTELSGPFDELIPCLASLLYTQERHLLIGTILVLTMLTLNESNRLYLLSGAITTVARVSQLLVINDEELVGVVIEYLYQYSRVSADFRRQLLLIHSGADIGILVSLLTAKSKYFTPKLIQEREEGSQASQSPASHGQSSFEAIGEPHGSVPCVPNLSAYQELDEPYRCLGWLKDKFEVTDRNSILSLDDMYLLYEMRFGQERALKMKDFYTVLKISFPEASATDSTQEGLVLEGTLVRGIQIKMSILKDGDEIMCQWTDCSKAFGDELHLQRHVLQDHVSEYQHVNILECMWTDCANTLQEFKDKDEMVTHLGTHFDDGVDLTPPIQHRVLGVDDSEPKGIALVAAHLLRQLSKDYESHQYFIPYENELLAIARRRPKMARHIQYMFSHFCIH